MVHRTRANSIQSIAEAHLGRMRNLMTNSITLDVFGRRVRAARSDHGWQIFYLSADGKRRPADDIMVPAFVTESEIVNFISDLCHEWATEKYPDVRRIE